ncbi:uncharacterized protein IUM83_19623 [Phytophthora cinnamomi]|uniref:uncharacterized protein n=1 Tax=Phytophthora cinnamomi TaxID=4785 RepID=UPI003559ECF0|nr:hypothetical protein IUM83_19623 [Phytophthora cinnamomi]
MSQAALAAWVKAHYKLKRAPAQSTVSDILKKAALIMSKDYGDGNQGDLARAAGKTELCLGEPDSTS